MTNSENNDDALYNWEELRQIYGENKGKPYVIDKDARLRFPNWTINKNVRIYVKDDSGKYEKLSYKVPKYGRIRLPVWTKEKEARIYVRIVNDNSTTDN